MSEKVQRLVQFDERPIVFVEPQLNDIVNVVYLKLVDEGSILIFVINLEEEFETVIITIILVCYLDRWRL